LSSRGNAFIAVVPAQAGTHNQRRPQCALTLNYCVAAAYGSPPSRGRQSRGCAATTTEGVCGHSTGRFARGRQSGGCAGMATERRGRQSRGSSLYWGRKPTGVSRPMPSLLRLAVWLCAALAAPAQAQDWPVKPVKIVVPFSAGGSSDQLARLLTPELAATFKQQFFIENRPGSSGALGSAQVARADPDGYTFVNAGSGPHLTGPAINPNIGYDPLKDFTHIAMEAADSFVLVAGTALGVKSIAELVALARTRPLTSASPGPGSLGQLILERFKRRAGIDIQHVPAPNSGMNEVV